jgi:hypothetical protein
MPEAPIQGPTLGQVITAALAHPERLPPLSPAQWRVLHALRVCRTPALGGHRYRCEDCGQEHFVPHSCGNRHCPQCQGAAAQHWLEEQQALLLPVPYFHLVFTLPHALNPLIRQNRRALYGLLFDATSQTLLTFGRNRFGAQLGITAVLHTWGQTLIDHYHLHCVVTGGGWQEGPGRWVSAPSHFLFPVKALAAVFQGKYLAGLQALYQSGKLEFHGELAPLATVAHFQALVREVSQGAWVVYAKRPFAGPEQVLRYVGCYTHRVAISPRRLLALDAQADTVTFDYKDYADGARHKTMTLTFGEFVRRFALHILPERLVKIRHYGLLANRGRQARVAQVQAALGRTSTATALQPEPPLPPATGAGGGEPGLVCPHCGAPALVLVARVPRPCVRHVPVIDSS